jgi:RNA polymerase sigma-70 factor, ECF subfamily
MEVTGAVSYGERAMTQCEDLPRLRAPAVWDAGWPQTLDGFEHLVDTFKDRLVRHAYRLVGNIADAEDVAQEVFVRSYADREGRAAVANVSAYLYRMTSNLAMDILRRQRGRTVSLDDAPAILAIPSQRPDAMSIAAAAEGIQRAEQLLACVSPEQAEVIRLRVLDELPPREIAAFLGCTPAAVKSRLRRGMETLRETVTGNRKVKP